VTLSKKPQGNSCPTHTKYQKTRNEKARRHSNIEHLSEIQFEQTDTLQAA